MRTPATRVLLLSSVMTCGCAGAAIDTQLHERSQSCQEGKGDECWRLGETWMRKASATYWTYWDRPVDEAAARRAYKKGCEGNSIRACTALIERHLLDGEPAEKERVLALINAVGVELRSDAEVAEQDAMLQKIIRAEDAHFTKQKSDAWDATLKAVSQLRVTGGPGHLNVVTPEVAQAQEQLKQMIEPQLKLNAAALAAAKSKKGSPSDAKGAAGARPGVTSGAAPVQPPTAAKSGAAGAGGAAAGSTPAQVAAAEKAKKLAACLAQPGPTQMRTAQTNPFQSYVTQYQSLLAEAGKCPESPGEAWKACIGMNARVWPDAEAQRDESDFNRRFNAVVSSMPAGPSACLYNQSLGSTRSFCTTMGKGACTQRIEQNIADMQCALSVLPRVWEGEMNRNDAAGKQRQDDDCRSRFP
jgi:hypothetical protein